LGSGLKKIAIKLALLGAATLATLTIAELSLRLFRPKYGAAAGARYEREGLRIWSRPANVRYERKHPDTGRAHPVIHNNLSCRQHRNFTKGDLAGAVNAGFFGDSFVENLSLPAPFAFTEPLDYLLNFAGGRFNVLNFGVDGYGTDQAFLSYLHGGLAPHLDYVFYVFCLNDLRNIYENNLFSLDEHGALIGNPAAETPVWIRAVSRLHLTYLILDFYHRRRDRTAEVERYLFDDGLRRLEHRRRFHSRRADALERSLIEGKDNPDLERSVLIFQSLLDTWGRITEEDGGRFFVVILPFPREHRAAALIGEQIAVIDLFRIFQKHHPDLTGGDIRFGRDNHWNELGNLLAAAHLYRVLEKEIGITPLPEDRLDRALAAYYSAFPGGRLPERWAEEAPVSDQTLERIRRRYTELEIDGHPLIAGQSSRLKRVGGQAEK
jgi:hypothetical protein